PGHAGRHRPIDLRPRVDQTVPAPTQIILPRVVGAIGEPQAEQARANRLRNLHALHQVRHRALAHRGIGMADAAQPVDIVLEDVGIHRADTHPALSRIRHQARPVVHPVPGYVDGHRRAYGRQLIKVKFGCVTSMRLYCTTTGTEARTRIAYGTSRGTAKPPSICGRSVRTWRVRRGPTLKATPGCGSRSSKKKSTSMCARSSEVFSTQMASWPVSDPLPSAGR